MDISLTANFCEWCLEKLENRFTITVHDGQARGFCCELHAEKYKGMEKALGREHEQLALL